jgi:hypothetical protein
MVPSTSHHQPVLPSRCGSGGGSPAGRRRRRPRTIPAVAELAGRRSGVRRGGDADSMLLLPTARSSRAYHPTPPPPTRPWTATALHEPPPRCISPPPHGGFELRCQKAVGSPHRSLVLPPADRLCSRNSPSLAPKTATCGRRRVKAQSSSFVPQVSRSERTLTSRFAIPYCPLLSPRCRRVAAPARPTQGSARPRRATQRSRSTLELVFDMLARWGPGTTRTWASRSQRRWSDARSCSHRPGHRPRTRRRHRALSSLGRHRGLEPDAAGTPAPAAGLRPAPGRLPRPATEPTAET